jgi:hypothetical protein
VIADRLRRHRHRPKAEPAADPLLHLGSVGAERGISAGAAAEHRDKDPWRRRLQPVGMPDQFVDPHRDLKAKRRRYRVLAIHAVRDCHIGAFLVKVGGSSERVAD